MHDDSNKMHKFRRLARTDVAIVLLPFFFYMSAFSLNIRRTEEAVILHLFHIILSIIDLMKCVIEYAQSTTYLGVYTNIYWESRILYIQSHIYADIAHPATYYSLL